MEFDECVVVPSTEFDSVHDFYHARSSVHHIHNIGVPTLFVNASDDPFADFETFPQEQIENNENTFAVVTSR